ncbi:MAG TPA: hypothetical protein VHL34_24615 [Rhizomicrobium sp.]|jgi:hypothetical protein|nr:hypothetical protein [Rhizomicrobium sp.]
MKPLITMSEVDRLAALSFCDFVPKTAETKMIGKLVDELDAQRAETPREQPDDLVSLQLKLDAATTAVARMGAELARVRQEAIDQCIAAIDHITPGYGLLMARERLEALRDPPPLPRQDGGQGEG